MTYMIQIDDEVREATAKEIAAIEAQQNAPTAAQVAAAKEATRAAALAKLGLTADEVTALFG